MQSVMVILLTRGVVGMLPDVEVSGKQFIAVTEETSIGRISSKSCILPKDFISDHKDQFGNTPFLIVDAWPLASVPFAMDQPGCGFGAMLNRPDGNATELYAGYGKHTGGLLSYYLLRALQGRAVVNFPEKQEEPPTNTPETASVTPGGKALLKTPAQIKAAMTSAQQKNLQMPKSILMNSPGVHALTNTAESNKGPPPSATPADLHKFLSVRLKRKNCTIISDYKEEQEEEHATILPGDSSVSLHDSTTLSQSKEGADLLSESTKPALSRRKSSRKMTEKEHERLEQEAKEAKLQAEAAARQRAKESNTGYPLLVFPHTLTELSIKQEKKKENQKFNRRIHVQLLVRQGAVMPVRYTQNEEAWKKYLDYSVRKAVAGSRFVPPNPNVGAHAMSNSMIGGGFTFTPNGDIAGSNDPHGSGGPTPSRTPPRTPNDSRPSSKASSKKSVNSASHDGTVNGSKGKGDSKKSSSLQEAAALAAAAKKRKKDALAKLDHIQLLFTREHPTKVVLEFHDMHQLVKDSTAKGKLEKGIWNTFAEVRKQTETDRYCFFRNHMASGVTEIDAPTPAAKHSLMELIEEPKLNPTRPKSILLPITATFIGSLRDFRRLEKAICTQPFFLNTVLVDCHLDPHDEFKHIGATKFQAVFRGFIVRRHIACVNAIVDEEAKHRRLQENGHNAFIQSLWKEHRSRRTALLFDEESFKRQIILDWEAKERREKADIQRVELQAREMLTRRKLNELEEQLRESHIETLYRNMLLDWANFEYTTIMRLHRTWFRCHWTRYYLSLERHKEYLTIRAAARKHIPNVSAAPPLEDPPTDFDFASSLVTLPRNLRSMRQSMQQLFDNTAMDRVDLTTEVDQAMPQSPRTKR